MKSNLYQNNNEVFVSKVLGEVFKSTGYIEMVGKWMKIRLYVVFLRCFLFICLYLEDKINSFNITYLPQSHKLY